MVNIKKCSCGFEVTEEMKHAYENEWCPNCAKGIESIKTPISISDQVVDCDDCGNKYTCSRYSTKGKLSCNQFAEEY